MDAVQAMLARAAELAKGMSREEAIEGMAEVCGIERPPSDLPADVRLRSEGWEYSRVRVLGGRVWVRGEERCVLTNTGDVRPF